MNKKLSPFILLIITVQSFSLPPKNFSTAKREARKIFSDNRETLYCGCKYDKYNRIDLKSCSMQKKAKSKRARRVEWEHMMAASHFSQHFKCWREKMCTKRNGKKYRGRKCCEKIDKRFRQVEAELFNLWPSVGSVNQYRSNYRYAEFYPESFAPKYYFQGCPIVKKKITNKVTRIEPKNEAKGIVARANLFMSKKYSIKLSKGQRRLFESWNKRFPPSQREKSWANKVKQVEGYSNPYIVKGK